MKKGGIPTFLSGQKIDDSDRGTCWHVETGKSWKEQKSQSEGKSNNSVTNFTWLKDQVPFGCPDKSRGVA